MTRALAPKHTLRGTTMLAPPYASVCDLCRRTIRTRRVAHTHSAFVARQSMLLKTISSVHLVWLWPFVRRADGRFQCVGECIVRETKIWGNHTGNKFGGAVDNTWLMVMDDAAASCR